MGNGQLYIESGIQGRGMGWKYKFESCQPINGILSHNPGQNHKENE